MRKMTIAVLGCLWVSLAATTGAPADDADRVAMLAGELADSSFKVRLKAAVLLGRTADEKAVGPLIKALRDENYVVRGAAARALGNLGLPHSLRAIEWIFPLADDEEPFVRKEAQSALARLTSQESLDRIIAGLSHEKPSVRQVAVRLLSAVVTLPDARAAIATALGDSDEDVRQEAVVAIKGMGQGDMEALLLSALWRRDNYRVQAGAVRLLGEMRTAASLGPLADLLVSDDVVPEVKKEAAEALASMKSLIDVKAQVAVLESSDRTAQDRAIKLLGIQGGQEAVEALLRLLKHSDLFVRRQAVFALGDAGDPRAVPALEYLQKTEDNQRFKDIIGRTIRKLKP
jgi:HEAT repeat protein